MNKRLRLMAGLCAILLFLLMAFATHYKIRLEQLEQSTGILELLAATIPLLSLLLASCFNRRPAPKSQQHPQNQGAQRQFMRLAIRRRPGSSARR